MGREIDLLKNYPKTKRNLSERAQEKTIEDRMIARQFGREFFDGERRHGYGGFTYQSRFWEKVIPDIVEYYNLSSDARILDIGCAKGFMLYDFQKYNSNFQLHGVDISEYAISEAVEDVKDSLTVGCATKLPYDDASFDLIISINTLHNLEGNELDEAFKEVSRVSRRSSFITVDAYRNEQEKKAMDAWNLTAKTILSVSDWVSYFERAGYKGDYFWFTP